MRVLFIAAHPDDIEYGCAGTIRNMIEKGDDVFWVLMSNGENDEGKNGRERIDELNESAEFLGVNNVTFMNIKDGFIEDNAENISRLSNVIDEIKPEVILTHYFDDRHQDHRNTSFCVRSACWGKYNLFYFTSYSTLNFSPSLFVDVTGEVENKIIALNKYKSQIEKYKSRGIDFIDNAITNNKQNGGNIHCLYAEGYQVANCVWKLL